MTQGDAGNFMKRPAQFIRLFRIVIPSVVIIFLSAPAYSQQGLRLGVKAPDFALPSVTGKKITLREFENKKVVIVHFWKSR